MNAENYYLKNKKRILREIKFAIPHYKRLAEEMYGADLANAVVAETLQRFETLLPELPDIGGKDNRLTENLYLGAAMLALYQTLKAHGKPIEEAAGIIYRGTQSFYSSFPFNLLLRWQGRQLFNRQRLEQRRREAEISQERRYPGDWVLSVVGSDDPNVLFAVDYTECGLVKYLGAQGAPELTPYLCWLDYPMCAAMRVGLVRTQTLAQGGEKCNFRFYRDEKLSAVTPDFLRD